MTTKTVKPAGGGDFTTLSGWLASLSTTLSAPQQADVYKNGSTGLVEAGGIAISGFTTTSTNKLIINVPTAEQHTGVKHTGAFLTNGASGSSQTFRVGATQDYIDVIGLEIEDANAHGVLLWAGSPTVTNNLTTFNKVLLHSNTSTILSGAASTQKFQFRNFIIYVSGSARPLDMRSLSTCEFSNGVVYSQSADHNLIYDGTGVTIKNVYSGGATTTCFIDQGTNTGSNNASSDTTATSLFTSSLASKAGSTCFTSVTSGSEDFTTKTGFTAFTDVGTTLGAFSDDIISTTRPQGSAWDIGPFENISGGGSTPTWAPLFLSNDNMSRQFSMIRSGQ